MKFDVSEALSKFKDRMKQIQEEFAKEAQPVLFDTFKKFLDEYPEIESFSWDQSSQCFNDEGYYAGIERFNVTFDSNMFPDLDEDEYNPEEARYYDLEEKMVPVIGIGRYEEMMGNLESLQGKIERSNDPYGGRENDPQIDMFMLVFGDNKNVTVSRSGFTIGKYSY